MENIDVEVLKAVIQSMEWEGFPDWVDRRAIHDRIQAEIVSAASMFGYVGVPEIPASYEDRDGRADVGWYDGSGELVCAVEVDGSVRHKSISKLEGLPDDVVKIVVSKSTNKSRINSTVEERVPDGIYHIDALLYESF